MEQDSKKDRRKSAEMEVFWGEIAPCDHVVQIYDEDAVFLETLTEFICGGLKAGDSVVIIATAQHRLSIEERLKSKGFDPFRLSHENKYTPLDAQETLDRFMIDGWPDALLFNHTISEIMKKARRNATRIRAFGEMVAVLWSEGHTGATVRLEHLWNQFMENNEFCLYCAYPKSGFTQNALDSVHTICCTHSKVIEGWDSTTREIFYSESEFKRTG